MERKMPPVDEAKHSFHGVQINDKFFLKSEGDTLNNRNVEWALYHYPNGVMGNEETGFQGDLDTDFHQSETFESYREAIKAARCNCCTECEGF